MGAIQTDLTETETVSVVSDNNASRWIRSLDAEAFSVPDSFTAISVKYELWRMLRVIALIGVATGFTLQLISLNMLWNNSQRWDDAIERSSADALDYWTHKVNTYDGSNNTLLAIAFIVGTFTAACAITQLIAVKNVRKYGYLIEECSSPEASLLRAAEELAQHTNRLSQIAAEAESTKESTEEELAKYRVEVERMVDILSIGESTRENIRSELSPDSKKQLTIAYVSIAIGVGLSLISLGYAIIQ